MLESSLRTGTSKISLNCKRKASLKLLEKISEKMQIKSSTISWSIPLVAYLLKSKLLTFILDMRSLERLNISSRKKMTRKEGLKRLVTPKLAQGWVKYQPVTSTEWQLIQKEVMIQAKGKTVLSKVISATSEMLSSKSK